MRVLRAIGVRVRMHVIVVVIVMIVIVRVMRAIEVFVIVCMIVIVGVIVSAARSCRRENREAAVAFGSHVRKPRRQSFEHTDFFALSIENPVRGARDGLAFETQTSQGQRVGNDGNRAKRHRKCGDDGAIDEFQRIDPT